MSAIDLSPLEVLVLKKLVLVNLALGKKIGGTAGREQLALTEVLAEITTRADLANHTAAANREDE